MVNPITSATHAVFPILLYGAGDQTRTNVSHETLLTSEDSFVRFILLSKPRVL
jgi:hypothetical protein